VPPALPSGGHAEPLEQTSKDFLCLLLEMGWSGGKARGSISSWMLRSTPGWRLIRPARSSVACQQRGGVAAAQKVCTLEIGVAGWRDGYGDRARSCRARRCLAENKLQPWRQDM
jgi:hypothetical protein